MKASRFCTNRKILAEGGESVDRFIDQGLTELGDKLGPINWQFMATKKFDPRISAPSSRCCRRRRTASRLRHAVEVRSPTFATEAFYDLARKHNVAIVYAKDEDFPEIDQHTADFTYARLMASREDMETGVTDEELDGFAKQAQDLGEEGRRVRLFHLRRQSAQPGGGAGADQETVRSRLTLRSAKRGADGCYAFALADARRLA